MTLTIPLFPLKTVLFPGGVLPLRIFEPRYLDMVSDCLKDETGIGVVLIRDGSEVGKAADTHYAFMGATHPDELEDKAREVGRSMLALGVNTVVLAPV